MNVDVKLNLPREVIADIGNQAVEDIADAFRDRAEEIVSQYQSKTLPRDTVREIVQKGQHSVLSVIDRESGALVFAADQNDMGGEYITIEMKGDLAKTFFAEINS